MRYIINLPEFCMLSLQSRKTLNDDLARMVIGRGKSITK